MRLENHTAAISGAGSGIGRACAIAYAREGAAVYLGDINEASVEQAAEEIRAGGGTAHAMAVDCSRPDGVRSFVQAAAETLGDLSQWLGSAGVGSGHSTLDLNAAEWARVMSINVDGVVFGSQAAAEIMITRGGGSIINIASMYGLRAVAGRIAYCTSKAAVIMATQCMAVELAEHGVRANAIGPGYADTPLFNTGVKRDNVDLSDLLAGVPMGRLVTPDEIGEVAVFLASDEARFVTGHCLVADGGWTAQGARFVNPR